MTAAEYRAMAVHARSIVQRDAWLALLRELRELTGEE